MVMNLEEGEIEDEEGEIVEENKKEDTRKRKSVLSTPEKGPTKKAKSSRSFTALECVYQSETEATEIRLNFNEWIRLSGKYRLQKAQLQKELFENVYRQSTDSTQLLRVAPTRTICTVVLKGCHPGLLAEELPTHSFFRDCTSLPIAVKRDNIGLDSLLFQYPCSPIDHRAIESIQDLLFKHELVFSLKHTKYEDWLILRPDQTFFRVGQHQYGTYDFDMSRHYLHLKWESVPKRTDVLENVDGTFEVFRTNPRLDDEFNPRFTDTDPAEERKMELILMEARPATAETKSPKTQQKGLRHDPCLDPSAIDYYLLSERELELFSYPLDVATEQNRLKESTKYAMPDQYIEIAKTSSTKSTDSFEDIVALDCEMCETRNGMELTRLTVINGSKEVVYDTFVQPSSAVVEYHTQYSGITADKLVNVMTTLADVQRKLVEEFIGPSTVIVGHSLSSDLRALRLIHHRVIDTAALFPHPKGYPFKCGLKHLAKVYLEKDIQNDIDVGHDSTEDAVCAYELFQLKLQNHDNPEFGLPRVFNRSPKFNTLIDQIPLWKIDIECHRPQMTFYQLDSSPPAKPWQRYSSGELNEFNVIEFAEQNGYSENVHRCPEFPELVKTIERNGATGEFVWVELNLQNPRDREHQMEQYLHNRGKWEKNQLRFHQQANEFLTTLQELLPKQALIQVVAQNDLQLIRELRAMRLQSRWKDSVFEWTKRDEIALDDAASGTLDSFVLLKFKK